MTEKTKQIICFTPADIRKLPTELQPQGKELRTCFKVCEGLARKALKPYRLFQSGTYRNFLINELTKWNVKCEAVIKDKYSSPDCERNERWEWVSLAHILEDISGAQKCLEEAFNALIDGDMPEYFWAVIGAGSKLGKLAYIINLIEANIYLRIGSLESSFLGASKGGIRSGQTRRNQSRVPTPESLRTERLKLVSAGKPAREISSMLASKYHCTTDHIRKLLKSD